MIKPQRHATLRLAIGGILLGITAVSYADDSSGSMKQPPDILFGPLFNDVQTAKLFPDQKTFADAVPKNDPQTILADYHMQRKQSGFDLRHFVDVNFTLPAEKEKYVPPAGQSLRAHIDGLWPVLTRTTSSAGKWDSLLPLPKPYVVPGGRFREIYYWDSYFTMLGLAESGHWDKVASMVDNFAYELDSWGHIPNGNRTYYLSRSQPPFFSLMVELLATHDSQALEKYKAMPQSKKQFNDSAWHYAGEVRWQDDSWIQKVGVAWTRAEKRNGVGYYDRYIGKNTRGRFNALTSAGKDYLRDGELALTSFTEYQFTESLASGIQVNYGQFSYKNNKLRTGEITWLNRWQPREGQLKDLTLAAQLGYGWSYKNINATPILNSAGEYQRSPSLSAEVGVTWKFGLL